METVKNDPKSLIFMRNNVIVNVRLKTSKNAKDTLEKKIVKLIAEQARKEK